MAVPIRNIDKVGVVEYRPIITALITEFLVCACHIIYTVAMYRMGLFCVNDLAAGGTLYLMRRPISIICIF